MAYQQKQASRAARVNKVTSDDLDSFGEQRSALWSKSPAPLVFDDAPDAASLFGAPAAPPQQQQQQYFESGADVHRMEWLARCETVITPKDLKMLAGSADKLEFASKFDNITFALRSESGYTAEDLKRLKPLTVVESVHSTKLRTNLATDLMVKMPTLSAADLASDAGGPVACVQGRLSAKSGERIFERTLSAEQVQYLGRLAASPSAVDGNMYDSLASDPTAVVVPYDSPLLAIYNALPERLAQQLPEVPLASSAFATSALGGSNVLCATLPGARAVMELAEKRYRATPAAALHALPLANLSDMSAFSVELSVPSFKRPGEGFKHREVPMSFETFHLAKHGAASFDEIKQRYAASPADLRRASGEYQNALVTPMKVTAEFGITFLAAFGPAPAANTA